MISANGGLPAHRYTPQVTPGWPRGSEPASPATPPRGRPPTSPAARSPNRACRPRGQCWAPTPTHPRPQHVGGGQVGGNRDRTAPPQSRQTEQGTRGRTRGGARTTWSGPTSAQCGDRARCARHTTQGGGGVDAAGARADTHARGTRGLPEGQPDRARGTHRPRGMAYQRARVRDTRRGRPATRSAEHAGRWGKRKRHNTR